MSRIRKNEGIASEVRTPMGFHLYESLTEDPRITSEISAPYLFVTNPSGATLQLSSNDINNPRISSSGQLVLNSGNVYGLKNGIYLNLDTGYPIYLRNSIAPDYEITVAGAGVSTILGENSISAQTATGTTITTFTPTIAIGNFEISAACDITSYTSGGLEMTVSWTDENGTARVATLLLASLSGTTSTSAAATGPFSAIPYRLRAQINTAITVATAGTFSATYDATAAIKQTG